MDKSKLIAIIVLVVGLGAIALFKEAPPPPDEDHDHDEQPAAQVQSTPSFDIVGGVKDLQVVDVTKGTGALAKAGDSVSVNYRGTLLDGSVFDQSAKPFEFPLGGGQVIKGWDKGVAGMRVGGKRKLTVPAALAYGDRSPSPKIPAGATLKFDVELLSVNGKG